MSPAPSVSTTSPGIVSSASFRAAPDDAAEISHIEMAALRNRLIQPMRSDLRNRVLARRIDVHQAKHVGVVEGAQKSVEEIAHPGISMRLEDRDDAALERSARRGERRLHFLRMMRVVVDARFAPQPHL